MDTRGTPILLKRAARSPWAAGALFAVLSIVATWPLAADLGRNVPSDYGDPLYVAWALAWVAKQAGTLLSGDLSGFTRFWDANQLYPEPAALALSDHFIAQALPLAPVYWATGDALLVLGLAYLMAFTLCGFCTWLLVRDLTGSASAGVLAGCAFAFHPFFLSFELAHLQVISAWGMPLTLFGLRRYFEHGRRPALAVAVFGMWGLSLSSGYYMVMFPPFVLLYAAWEITGRQQWANQRMWRDLVSAGVVLAVLLAPTVWPYIEARQRLGFSRTSEETRQMAATVDHYVATVPPLVIPYLMAAAALVAWLSARLRGRRSGLPMAGLACVGAVFAFWLSLGPEPVWADTSYPSLGLYGLVQAYMPGMNAVRVSSRFAVVFALFLAVLAGWGAAMLARRHRRGSMLVLVLAGLSVVINSPWPLPLNRPLESTADVRSPAAYLTPGSGTPEVYRYLASLASPVVVAELPFTDLWYNTRYLYFSTLHWHPLVNGFTSFFPPHYEERAAWLVDPLRTPDEAWTALAGSGATLVVVHTGAWTLADAGAIDDWLLGHGARSHGAFDGAVVYELPPSPR